MDVSKKNPAIAVLFGGIAIGTGALMLVQPPLWLRWVGAIFWFITGILGLFVAVKSMR
jgi:hypothetical protein